MIIVLTVRKDFHYGIEISAKAVKGKMIYMAELAESAPISHFDTHQNYEGDTIEAAISSIADGIEAALVMLHAT